MPITETETINSLKAICKKFDKGKAKVTTFKLLKSSINVEWLTGFILNEVNGFSKYSTPLLIDQRMGELKYRFKNANDLLPVIVDIASFINVSQGVEISPSQNSLTKTRRKKKLTEGERLAQFCELVHDSSLKRFNQVKPDDREWKPSSGQLSFADILKHLMDAERWVLAVLNEKRYVPKAAVKPGDGRPEEWDEYLRYWEKLYKEKIIWLRKATDKDLSKEDRGGNEASKWHVLTRGNLDHEIHHRGALQVMLRLKYNP